MTIPTTPTKPKRAEFDTIRRTRFYDVYDDTPNIPSFREFCKLPEIDLNESTARKWLKQREEIGAEAY